MIPPRGSPCLCGSGRPLSDCCLPWEEAFQRLASRCLAFAAEPAVAALIPGAREVFFGASDTPAAERSGGLRFQEWLLHDYAPPQGRGVLLGDLADRLRELPLREAQLLTGALLAPVRAYQVADAPGPRGILLKDLLTGAEQTLAPLGLDRAPIRSDLLVCRLLPLGRLLRAGMGVLWLPDRVREELFAYLRLAYQVSRPARHVSLEDFLDGAPHLYQHFALLMEGRAEAAEQGTVREVAFAPGRLAFRPTDAGRVRAALSRQPEIETESAEAETGRFTWLDGHWGVARAKLSLDREELTVQVESREDLVAAGLFLERILGGLVRRAEPAVQEEPPPLPGPPSGSRPWGAAFLRRQVTAWADTPHPRLADRTPRLAAASPGAGGRGVAELLGELEQALARQRRLGRGHAETSGLRELLGLEAPAERAAGPKQVRGPAKASPRPRRPKNQEGRAWKDSPSLGRRTRKSSPGR